MIDHLDARLAADLWFFRVLAEAQSFSRAADLLAVTQRIQRLEDRLGVDLFLRNKRTIRLTPAADLLYASARKGFDIIATALPEIRAASGATTLTVNCAPSLALEWLTPRLSKFEALHADISVTVFAEMHPLDTSRMIADGIDVAIRYGPEPPADAIVAFEHPEQLFPVTAPSLREQYECASSGSPVVLLHDARPWAQVRSSTTEWAYWLKANGPLWGKPSQERFFNLAGLAYQYAMNGAGIALGRTLIVSSRMKARQLVPAIDLEPVNGLSYYVMTRTASPDGPVDKFITWLHREMSSDLWPELAGGVHHAINVHDNTCTARSR